VQRLVRRFYRLLLAQPRQVRRLKSCKLGYKILCPSGSLLHSML
jgi:hypothetical protein